MSSAATGLLSARVAGGRQVVHGPGPPDAGTSAVACDPEHPPRTGPHEPGREATAAGTHAEPGGRGTRGGPALPRPPPAGPCSRAPHGRFRRAGRSRGGHPPAGRARLAPKSAGASGRRESRGSLPGRRPGLLKQAPGRRTYSGTRERPPHPTHRHTPSGYGASVEKDRTHENTGHRISRGLMMTCHTHPRASTRRLPAPDTMAEASRRRPAETAGRVRRGWPGRRTGAVAGDALCARNTAAHDAAR
jgi:hypothetical protein